MDILKNYFWGRRRQKIQKQIGDLFSWLGSAMKAGLSFPQGLQTAAEEIPSPLKEELQMILERVKIGKTLEDSLLISERALKLPDFSLMVYSVILLRQVGGNFVSHFENLGTILRERQEVSEKISLLTSQGLMQGAMLGLMPLGLGLGLFFLSPAFLSPLWETAMGWVVLGMIVSLDLGGYLWMRSLAKVKI